MRDGATSASCLPPPPFKRDQGDQRDQTGEKVYRTHHNLLALSPDVLSTCHPPHIRCIHLGASASCRLHLGSPWLSSKPRRGPPVPPPPDFWPACLRRLRRSCSAAAFHLILTMLILDPPLPPHLPYTPIHPSCQHLSLLPSTSMQPPTSPQASVPNFGTAHCLSPSRRSS